MWGTGKKARQRVKRPEKQQTFPCTGDGTALENVRAQTNNKMKSHGTSQRTSDMAGYVLSPLSHMREEAGAFQHRYDSFYSHPTD